MRFGKSCLLFILTLSLSSIAESSNCVVSILSVKNSGEKIRVNFNSHLHSKQECKTLAEMHYPNFAPDQVKSKTVTYHWEGQAAEGQTGSEKMKVASKRGKKASSLAVAKRKNKSRSTQY